MSIGNSSRKKSPGRRHKSGTEHPRCTNRAEYKIRKVNAKKKMLIELLNIQDRNSYDKHGGV